MRPKSEDFGQQAKSAKLCVIASKTLDSKQQGYAVICETFDLSTGPVQFLSYLYPTEAISITLTN